MCSDAVGVPTTRGDWPAAPERQLRDSLVAPPAIALSSSNEPVSPDGHPPGTPLCAASRLLGCIRLGACVARRGRSIPAEMGGTTNTRLRFASLVAACALAVIASAATAHAADDAAWAARSKSTWKRESGLVFALDLTNPDIVKLPDGRWRAYLMGGAGITSAISSDGRSFVAEPGVRLNGAEHHAALRLPDGRVRIFFSKRGEPAPRNVYSALSDDGLAFAEEPGVRLSAGGAAARDAAAIIHPHVIALRGGGYRMYYDADAGSSGQAPNWRGIMSARSADGLNWVKEAGTRIRAGSGHLGFADLVWSPFAQRSGSGYRLYFSVETDRQPARRAGVYRASSRDGLHFTVAARPEFGLSPSVGSNPRTGPGGMEGLPQDTFIIVSDAGQRLFYWEARRGTLSALRRARSGN